MGEAKAAEARISEQLQNEVLKIDKNCIRPLQVEAFQCSAKCCQDRNSPQEVIQGCLANCMQPVLDAEKRLQAEIEQLQDRVSRCAKHCEDEYKDALPSGGQAGPVELERAQQAAQKCLVKCCDNSSQYIPKFIAKYRASLRTC